MNGKKEGGGCNVPKMIFCGWNSKKPRRCPPPHVASLNPYWKRNQFDTKPQPVGIIPRIRRIVCIRFENAWQELGIWIGFWKTPKLLTRNFWTGHIHRFSSIHSTCTTPHFFTHAQGYLESNGYDDGAKREKIKLPLTWWKCVGITLRCMLSVTLAAYQFILWVYLCTRNAEKHNTYEQYKHYEHHWARCASVEERVVLGCTTIWNLNWKKVTFCVAFSMDVL